jgi:ABC-type multidrug transport system ATPase subunit
VFAFVCPSGRTNDRDYFLLTIGIIAILAGLTIWGLFRAGRLQFLFKQRSGEEAPLVEFQRLKDTFTQRQGPMTLRFHDLCLDVKKKHVLTSISGEMRPGRVVAIMGPSGCGKSSLLNVLMGKANAYGQVSGEITVNREGITLSKLASAIGFVPQEDIMLRVATVEETLRTAALLRLPSSYTMRQIRSTVKIVLDMLGLTEIRTSIIGDEETRGISGGQRKRVNIGMELVASPSILFLDEPTSGLDSSTSMDVCQRLKEIAQEANIIVAAVIH